MYSIDNLGFRPTRTNRPSPAVSTIKFIPESSPSHSAALDDSVMLHASGAFHLKDTVIEEPPCGKNSPADLVDHQADASTTSSATLRENELKRLWGLTDTRNPIIVAILDSGADAEHPALNGLIIPGSPTTDELGSGTHLTGIIAGIPRQMQLNTSLTAH